MLEEMEKDNIKGQWCMNQRDLSKHVRRDKNMQNEKRRKELKPNGVSSILLLVNASVRLLFIIGGCIFGNFSAIPIEMTLLITGILTLSAGIVILAVEIHGRVIAGMIASWVAIVITLGFDVWLCTIVPPLQNFFLWVSVASLIAIVIEYIALYIEYKKPKAISSASKTSLIVLMLTLSFFVGIGSVKANQIVDHQDLTSSNGKFKVSVYVYKYENIIQSKDFYGFWVLLHTDELPYIDWVNRFELLCSSESIIDDWQPRDGLTTGGSIGLTPSGPSVSIAIPMSDTKVDGKYTNKISWFVNPLSISPQDLEFATKLWIPIGTPLYWKLGIEVVSGDSFLWAWHECWRDCLEFSTFPVNLQVSTGKGGTTNHKPGTYCYEQPTTTTVTAIPSGSNEFWKWEVTDGRVKKVYFENPLTVTLANGTWTLTCYFKQSIIWIGHSCYHWTSGAICCIVYVAYFDMDWNFIGLKIFRWIENYW